MFNTVSGYHTFPATQMPVLQKNSPPVIPYLGSPESTLYQHSAPVTNQRGQRAFVSSNPARNRGFARSGCVTLVSPQQFSMVASINSSATESHSKDMMPSSDIAASNSETDALSQQQADNLANTKEKTPMCLINELARFNKVQHQYCLTDEQGPAHKKTFFVKLKLGEEEFAASGASIKKAQHAAADVALEQTKYPHPAPKKSSSSNGDFSQTKSTNSSVTPTVELNALAMKRGELASYRPIERKTIAVAPAPYFSQPYGTRANGFYGQRSRYQRPPHRFFVALKVGEREFVGEGETLQAARHNAASMALKVLKNLPLPTDEQATKLCNSEDDNSELDGVPAKVGANGESLKSEISLVHEIALKRNFTVEFEIIKESGPPHMRTFITCCKCGDLTAEGEGSSKKLSKKRAAEKMVEEFGKLPQLPPTPPGVKPKKTLKPKQSKNLIKNVLNNCSAGVNPISRLIQIQQAKKEKEPTFAMVEEKGLPRAREFHIQVTVGENTCTGIGSNKRLAKRSAAEQMLQMLGYSLLAPQPPKPAMKAGDDQNVSSSPLPTSPAKASSSGGTINGDKRVTFVEPDHIQTRLNGAAVNRSERHSIRHSPVQQNVVTGSSEIGLSARAGPPVNQSRSSTFTVRPMDQLAYLAKIMQFEFNVSNYPKDEDKTEILSVITIGRNNKIQYFNGTAASIEAANDNAAMDALRKLSEHGLVAQSQAGDGPFNRSSPTKNERTRLSNSSVQLQK